MKILHELCSTPTAPFAEQKVIDYIEAFAARRKRLRLSRDRWGNRMLELPGTGKGPRWVFAAHMDHPGFVADRRVDANTLEARFHGGVLGEYVDGAKVRFFTDAGEITGRVTAVASTENARSSYPNHAVIAIRGDIPAGTVGMFDQGEGRVKGKRFYSRVCDNLAGAATALSMLDQLHRRPPQATICVLLTRAEEEGFIGAVGAATQPRLLHRTDRIITIECSAQQPYAPQGKGCIIRVGDRSSIFNSDLTYFMTHQAEELKKKDPAFQFQRALMPGGTCEATAYDIYGFIAGSICVALGNYHNMDRQKKKIAPEYVDTNDWRHMMQLFVHLARTGHTYQPGHALLKARIGKRFDAFKHLL